MPHFFFPSFDLRIPRLFLKKKKRKSLLYPIYLICLAISLETCHVNNNAQLYTIRPSFTAAYLGIFQKKKNTLPDSPILIPPILEFSRATPRGDTRGIDRRPSSRSSLFDTKLRSIDRSIDRCQSIERKWTLREKTPVKKRNEKRDDETRTKTDTTKFPYKTSLSSYSSSSIILPAV